MHSYASMAVVRWRIANSPSPMLRCHRRFLVNAVMYYDQWIQVFQRRSDIGSALRLLYFPGSHSQSSVFSGGWIACNMIYHSMGTMLKAVFTVSVEICPSNMVMSTNYAMYNYVTIIYAADNALAS